MATRYGYRIAERLVEEHGWKWAPMPEDYFGDPGLIDPLTGERCTPYEAQARQDKRDQEDKVDEAH